jgi:hypothetical protein
MTIHLGEQSFIIEESRYWSNSKLSAEKSYPLFNLSLISDICLVIVLV